jgi:hypothetical protein
MHTIMYIYKKKKKRQSETHSTWSLLLLLSLFGCADYNAYEQVSAADDFFSFNLSQWTYIDFFTIKMS